MLEAPDLSQLFVKLTQGLPRILDVDGVTLLLWDRKLDTFESLTAGETRGRAVRPGEATPTPEARFLISDGHLLETQGTDDGVLLPLMARSGLVGMLVLGPRRGQSYRASEVRVLSALANRAALALENHLYQRELIASERMAALGTMAGMLAHDFRGPMTVIKGYAELILRQAETPSEAVLASAKQIVDAVDRLDRMTTETLDFARGGGKLVRRSVVVAELLAELCAGLGEEQPGLTVVRDFDLPAATRACVDVDKLRRALGNLAANSRDAMQGRGRFQVQARLDGAARLVLDLADEGPGIPAEIRERLFEPFVTLGKKQGTGLGLAVARRFVEDHGGSLELLPQGPGARFRIVLPLAGVQST